MESKRKQMLVRQKASFEQKLQNRLAFLNGKGMASPETDKDTLVRKIKADIKAADNRLRLFAANDKITEENALRKAERAAAPKKEKESGKDKKPKKAPEKGKEKKPKS
ncbi:MAG: hypothetical protein SCM96_13805 [Acidobacteriota bacterium]|nr:hypothetical protein [Acidobacteriota bacterium]